MFIHIQQTTFNRYDPNLFHPSLVSSIYPNFLSSVSLHLRLEKDMQTISWDKAYWSRNSHRPTNSSLINMTMGTSGSFGRRKKGVADEGIDSEPLKSNFAAGGGFSGQSSAAEGAVTNRNLLLSRLRFSFKHNYFVDSNLNNNSLVYNTNNNETSRLNNNDNTENSAISNVCDNNIVYNNINNNFGFLSLSIIKKIQLKIDTKEIYSSDYELSRGHLSEEHARVEQEEAKRAHDDDLVFCKLTITYGNITSENKNIGFRLPLRTGMIWRRCLARLVNANIYYARLERLKKEEWIKFAYLSFVYKSPGCSSNCGCCGHHAVACCGWCACRCRPYFGEAIEVRWMFFSQLVIDKISRGFRIHDL